MVQAPDVSLWEIKSSLWLWTYAPEEAAAHRPNVVFVDEENAIGRCMHYEQHGRLEDMA